LESLPALTDSSTWIELRVKSIERQTQAHQLTATQAGIRGELEGERASCSLSAALTSASISSGE
jgi:hypothetical protein